MESGTGTIGADHMGVCVWVGMSCFSGSGICLLFDDVFLVIPLDVVD